MTSDLTTMQWAGLLDRQDRLMIQTVNRVAEGRLRSVWLRKVELDYPPGGHDGFPLGVERATVERVWRREGRRWVRVRTRRQRERAG